MLTRSHRLVSVAVVELALISSKQILINPASDVILLLATAIGATLPDIDEYNSSASRNSLINFSLLLKHRGITHSLVGWGIFAGVLYFFMGKILPINLNDLVNLKLPNSWACLWLGFIAGYLLHLIEDSFSNYGVNWLAPFIKRKKYRRFLRYKVGGFFEKLLTLIAIISIFVMTSYWLFFAFKINKFM